MASRAVLRAELEAKEAQLVAEVEELTAKLATTTTKRPISTSAGQSDASTMVEIAKMLRSMPTEALADMLSRMRGRTSSADAVGAGDEVHPPTVQLAAHPPPSLALGSGEATALVEIMAMMESMPTPALAEMLGRLKGVENAAAPRLELERQLRRPGSASSSGLVAPLAASPVEPGRRAHHDPVMHSGRARLLRSILLNFFQKHAPEGLHKVEDLVARVVGGAPTHAGGVVVGGVLWSEQELFAKLEAKYGAKVDLDPQERD
jgi:hypothetical protein